MTEQIGSLLGVLFEVKHHADTKQGFTLSLTDEDTHEYLFQQQMTHCTLFEGVCEAVSAVWKDEIHEHRVFDFPQRIARKLNITEEYTDE